MTPPEKKTPSQTAAAQGDRPSPPGEKRDDVWCRDYRGRPYTFNQALDQIRAFHGHVAPGLVMGLKMVYSAGR